jgi:hypothetical protein
MKRKSEKREAEDKEVERRRDEPCSRKKEKS